MGAMTKIQNGAEAATEMADDIRAEIPKYREMAETITLSILLMSTAVALLCLTIALKNAAR